MDPLSVAAFAVTVLQVGISVSVQINGVITTWKTADAVLLALANEASDLNLVLDHTYRAWQGIAECESQLPAARDETLSGTLASSLEQADTLLRRLQTLILDIGSRPRTRRRYAWLQRHSLTADLQGDLRNVRLRLTELLLANSA
jgi:hypothetical protein